MKYTIHQIESSVWTKLSATSEKFLQLMEKTSLSPNPRAPLDPLFLPGRTPILLAFDDRLGIEWVEGVGRGSSMVVLFRS